MSNTNRGNIGDIIRHLRERIEERNPRWPDEFYRDYENRIQQMVEEAFANYSESDSESDSVYETEDERLRAENPRWPDEFYWDYERRIASLANQNNESDDAYQERIQQIASEESDNSSDYSSNYETYGEQLRRLRANNPQGQYDEAETDEDYQDRIFALADEENNRETTPEITPELNNEDNAEQAELINNLRMENPKKEGESNKAYNTRIASLALENEKPMGYGECPICSEPLTSKKVVVDAHPTKKSNYSGHNCHKDCLLKWCKQNASCPICRAKVDCISIANDKTREVIIENRLQGGKRRKTNRRQSKRKKDGKRSRSSKTKRRKGTKKRKNSKKRVTFQTILFKT